jgi:hypothetical protein
MRGLIVKGGTKCIIKKLVQTRDVLINLPAQAHAALLTNFSGFVLRGPNRGDNFNLIPSLDAKLRNK